MRRTIAFLLVIVLFLASCGSQSSPKTPAESTQDVKYVDLGCCVTGIAVRDKAVLGANSTTHTKNDFVMTLNSDKKTYKTTDVINLWGTLEYTGGDPSITIWHGCPFMVFSISSGEGFKSGGAVVDILTSSSLERKQVYHFDYQKSGSYNTNDQYWQNFYQDPVLKLPPGKYTITLMGDFSLSDKVIGSESGLKCTLAITVK